MIHPSRNFHTATLLVSGLHLLHTPDCRYIVASPGDHSSSLCKTIRVWNVEVLEDQTNWVNSDIDCSGVSESGDETIQGLNMTAAFTHMDQR